MLQVTTKVIQNFQRVSYVEKHVSGWISFFFFFNVLVWFGFWWACSVDLLILCRGIDHSKAIYKSALFLYLIFITNNVPLWLHEIIRSVFNYHCVQPLITTPSSILNLEDDVEKGGGVSGKRANAQLVMYCKCQVTAEVYIFI